MKPKLLIILSLVLMSFSVKDSKYSDYPIEAIGVKDVKLSDGFWLQKIKTIKDSTISYSFKKCEEEGRMDNFLIAGGKLPGKTKGKMPFDDTDLYKIIEGASLSLISDPDTKLDAYIDSIIEIIKVGQEPDGYITTWFTIDRTSPPADWVKPSKERWENEISSHELYNSGHLFEAAATHFLATGKRNLLDIALKNADLLVSKFGPGKLQVPPGHEIIETGLVKLYRITHKPAYLDLSKFFLDIRGDASTHKLYGAYNQDHLKVTKQSDAVGHAVRAVYMYAGMTDIAALYKDSNYLDAVKRIWDNVVNAKTYITGGLGARHDGESFGDDYELPNLTAYSETCAAIGSVGWNQRLFQLTGDSKYYDVIERTLYNGLISGISQDGKTFFYPNPLESDGKYKFNMGAATRQPWFDCSCCPTNLIRFIPSVPGLIYSKRADSVYINLFIGSNVNMKIGKKDLNIVQKTDYPWKGIVSLVVNPKKTQKFTLKIRVPGWVMNKPMPGNLYSYQEPVSEKYYLGVNGREVYADFKNGYLEISREWKKGDEVELHFPMSVRRVITSDKVKDNKGKIAIEYGPVVYCAESVDNGKLSGLFVTPATKFEPVNEKFLSDDVVVLKNKVRGHEITLIPYYLWSNRGVGEMKVWLNKGK